MGYVSNTDADRAEMLAAIGVGTFEELLAPIPEELRFKGALNIPSAMGEHAVLRHLQSLAAKNHEADGTLSFLGAGIYNHFRPAVVAAMMSRGEFMTAYTPYQPELSQGMLQTIYEYQTMICAITGMEVSNASMYDASTGLAEAALMATSILNRTEVVIAGAVHPNYIEVVETYTRWTGYKLVVVPAKDGTVRAADVKAAITPHTAAVLFQHPNFFGLLEDLQSLVEAAHEAGALAIACVDPISLGLINPPGKYGVDIVVGEGQSLGTPMGFGGPLLGFFACKKQFVRSFPGRVVGATVDQNGKRGYTMTLRTREQDIRREKATSNICTNQALIALCATVYLSELGKNGLQKTAELCLQKSHYALEQLTAIPGVEATHSAGRFVKEFAITLPIDAAELNDRLLDGQIIGGLPLGHYDSNLAKSLLVCVTETHTKEDIDRYVAAVRAIVSDLSGKIGDRN